MTVICKSRVIDMEQVSRFGLTLKGEYILFIMKTPPQNPLAKFLFEHKPEKIKVYVRDSENAEKALEALREAFRRGDGYFVMPDC